MKQAHIESAPGAAVSDAQLERINRYTRRALEREEVFVFSLILCDNEIDRDGERFPRSSLEALAKLFLGKTGIFDHSPVSKNQSARIFEAAVEELPGQIEGEPLCRLRAWAYMLRSDKNKELIFEIDGGIKKEVSVGCAVARITCSVCGADWKQEPCGHEKGRRYGEAICHHRLEEPTDAYEWSFVAVPAQKNAGVTKRAPGGLGERADLSKLFEAEGDVALTAADLAALKGQYKALWERARAGERYLAELRGGVVRLLALTRPEIPASLAEEIAGGLELHQLDEMQKALSRAAAEKLPLWPQLARGTRDKDPGGGSPFVI